MIEKHTAAQADQSLLPSAATHTFLVSASLRRLLQGALDFRRIVVSSRVPKWLKFMVAVLLLPFCFGAAVALGQVLSYTGRAETIWIAVLAGAGCWMAV